MNESEFVLKNKKQIKYSFGVGISSFPSIAFDVWYGFYIFSFGYCNRHIDWLTGKFQFGVQITRLVKETQCENYMHIEIGQSVIGLSIEYFSCCRICARQKQSERKKKRAKSINMKILLSSAKVMCVWFHACEWNEGERGSDK